MSVLSLSFLIHDPRTPTSEWVVLSTEPGAASSETSLSVVSSLTLWDRPPSPSFQLQGPFSQTLKCSTSVYLPLLSLLPEMPSPPSLFMEQCLPNWYPFERSFLWPPPPAGTAGIPPWAPQSLFSLGGKKRTTQLERSAGPASPMSCLPTPSPPVRPTPGPWHVLCLPPAVLLLSPFGTWHCLYSACCHCNTRNRCPVHG